MTYGKYNVCPNCGTQLWDYIRDVPTVLCPRCSVGPPAVDSKVPPPRVVTLRVAATQEDLSCQLMEALRAVILSPKYDPLYISTLLGVLVMLQHESIERSAAK